MGVELAGEITRLEKGFWTEGVAYYRDDLAHECRMWTSPRQVLVNSMSDLFHADIPEQYVRQIFEIMLDAKVARRFGAGICSPFRRGNWAVVS